MSYFDIIYCKEMFQKKLENSNISQSVFIEIVTAENIQSAKATHPQHNNLINKLNKIRHARRQFKSISAHQLNTNTPRKRLAHRKLRAISDQKREAEYKISKEREAIAAERHRNKIAEIAAAGKKYGWTIKCPSDAAAAAAEAVSAHLKLLARILRKKDWTTTHSSKCRHTRRITSRYLAKKIPTDFAEMPQQYVKLRLSEHYIQAAEWLGREGSTLGGADGEIVVDIQMILKGYSIEWWLRACLLAAHGRSRF